MTRSLINSFILFFFLFAVVLFTCLPLDVLQQAIFSKSGSGITIQDFLYYISLVRAWWAHPGDPYAPQFHMAFLSSLAGSPIQNFMPLGLTPTFLLVLAPFAAASAISGAHAYVLWLAASLSAYIAFLLALAAQVKHKHLRAVIVVFGLGALCSQAGGTALQLGQTSVMGAAILGMIALICGVRGEPRIAEQFLAGCLLFVLSIKIHYFLLGCLLLVSARMWRAMIFCAALSLIGSAALWLYSGQPLYPQFIQSLAYFGGTSGHPQVDQVALITSNTFRSAFASDLGLARAAQISRLAVLILLPLSFAWCLLDRAPRLVPFALGSAILLCFMPYVGAYDDVLSAIPVLFLLACWPALTRTQRIAGLALAAIGLTVLNRAQISNAITPLVWVSKCVLLFGCAVLMQQVARRKDLAAQS